MRKWAAIRRPVLMEDEGRYELTVVRNSKKECEEFIAEYCKDGYFSRGDFLILEEQEEEVTIATTSNQNIQPDK